MMRNVRRRERVGAPFGMWGYLETCLQVWDSHDKISGIE